MTYGTQTNGNIETTETLKTHNHEEADTLLLRHAFSLDSTCEVVIQSPDTDVRILMMYQKLPPNICFKTGTADKLRKIDICKLFYTLGERRSLALLGFHVFTGSDVSGKFAGRSKEFCFKTFLSCNDDVLIALENLGNILREDVFNNLEKFVCLLYRNKKILERL